MRILPPVHKRRPFDHHAKLAPELLASRWKSEVPIYQTIEEPEASSHEKTEDPLLQVASVLGSLDAQHPPLAREERMPHAGEKSKEESALLWKHDKGRRNELREMGYSDKIVEKLTPYQAYWLHRYHIYNHADEIFHPEPQFIAVPPSEHENQ